MIEYTDILIPLGDGSRHNNIELKYCLRSIEKYLKGVGRVCISGCKPDWVSDDVPHLPAMQDNPNSWQRAWNIYRKIMAGIKYCDLSDNFLYMNDDHFLLTDYVASEFPYYHRGVLDPHKFAMNQPQFRQMSNTIELFAGEIYDFDVHCPVVINKHIFHHALPREKWPEHGYGIKSAFCNMSNDTTNWIPCEDLKFSQPAMKESIYRALEGRQWFSVGDRCLRSGDMKQVLQELYPNKSIFEI